MRYAALIGVVLLLAGCGGGSAARVSGSAASIVPSTTTAFLALGTHLSATQWAAADELLARFPVQDAIFPKLKTLSLGSEVDVAALGSGVVILAKKDASIAGFSTKKVSGWTAYARDASKLDTLGGSATLADVPDFKEASASLTGNPIASAYASGTGAQQLLGALPSQDQVQRIPHIGIGITPHRGAISNAVLPEQFSWAEAGVIADGKGVRIEAHGHVRAATQDELANSALMQVPIARYVSHLADEIPADALAVLDLELPPGQFEILDPATFPPILRDLAMKDPSLAPQLDFALGGETAIYIEQTRPLVATIVTHPQDTKSALENVAALEPAIRLKLHTAVLGGELVISSSAKAIATFSGPGTKLSQSKTFASAAIPAATTGYLWGSGAALGDLARLLGVSVPVTTGQVVLYSDRVGAMPTTVLLLQDG